jgi:outer membrane protein OmpA-like peptidoglycan-associated protein
LRNIAIILLIFSCLLESQTDSTRQRRTISKEELEKKFSYPFFFGVFGGATLINSQMQLPIIPLSDDCGVYEEGTGQDIYLGLETGGSLFFKWLANDFRFWYEGRPVTLQTQTSGPLVLNSQGEYVTFIRDHEYNAYLNYLALDIGLRIRPLEALDEYFNWSLHKTAPIYLRFSYSASDPMFDATFDNIQFVNAPNNVTFPNGRIDQLVDEGEIQGGRTTSALNFEIGASWDLTEEISIAPQFSYRYELEAPYSQYDWNYQVFRAGVSIQFHQNRDYFDRLPKQKPREKKQPDIKEEPIIAESKELIDKPEVIEEEREEIADIVPIIKEEPEPEIDSKDILKFEVNPLNITETVVTQTYPVLPYIFFEENSSRIPNRYIQNSNDFSEEDLPKETIGIYYNLLDIIGSRLKSNNDSKITLVGTSDGIESENILQLTRERSQSVKDYFIKNWGISSDRIKIEARNLPNLATNMEYAEGASENRRVEIVSNDPEILKPISHSRFIENKANKDAFNYPVELNNNDKIISANISIYLDEEKLYTSYLAGNPGTNPDFEFPNNIVDEISKIANKNSDLKAVLTLEKEGDKQEIIEKEIPYTKTQNQFEVGRLNLIVFDFDKAEISDQNKEMIRKFLDNSIQDNSKTTITGSTDRLGEADYNKELSQKRAESVAKFIKQFKPNYSFESVKGIGSSNLAFDNDSPEGRFYCRTVLVEVKTPIGE